MFVKGLIVTTAMLGVAGTAGAATTATANGSTTIVSAISIAKDDDLAFGTIIRPSAGSTTVTLPTNADIVALSGAGTGAATAGSAKRAKFTVTGDGAQSFSLSAPTLTLNSGANNINVTLTPSETGTIAFDGAAGSDATKEIFFGGNFAVSSTTVAGVYTGAFSVDVQYE